eukprot:6970353-Pyramimonas_sp.AAC.1
MEPVGKPFWHEAEPDARRASSPTPNLAPNPTPSQTLSPRPAPSGAQPGSAMETQQPQPLQDLVAPRKKKRGPKSKKDGKNKAAANRMFSRHVRNAKKLDKQGAMKLDPEAKEFLK